MHRNYQEIMGTERYMEIVNRIGPDIEDIFRQFKGELGGRLPAEMSYGMVAGYLRGKGFTWEECFIGMNRFICIIEHFGVVGPVEQKTMTILAKTDGSVDVGLKP